MEYEDPPIVDAAANPDSSALRRLLEEYAKLPQERTRGLLDPDFQCTEDIQNHLTTPLIAASRAGLREHVELLLRAGASPDGVRLEGLKAYCQKFARHRPQYAEAGLKRIQTVAHVDQTPDLPHEHELESRTGCAVRVRFWSELNFPHDKVSSDQRERPLTALEAASESGNIDIIRMLLDSGADTAAWIKGSPSSRSTPLGASYFAPSPLIAAIQYNQHGAFEFLLEQGFDVAAMQRSAPTVCMSPLMTAVTHRRLKMLEKACQIAPPAQIQLQTPVYGITATHFAAANHSTEALQILSQFSNLKTTPNTNLGHTLLHIASLPLNDTSINIFSRAIASSIHDIRTFSIDWKAEKILFFRTLELNNPEISSVELHEKNSAFLQPQSEETFTDQENFIKFLIDEGLAEVSAQDYLGNTALHYLASYRTPNKQAMELLLSLEGAKDVWDKTLNDAGYTPHELFEFGTLVSELRELTAGQE